MNPDLTPCHMLILLSLVAGKCNPDLTPCHMLGSKTLGNLEPGSPNAIFEFQEFEMQFLEANFFLLGQLK